MFYNPSDILIWIGQGNYAPAHVLKLFVDSCEILYKSAYLQESSIPFFFLWEFCPFYFCIHCHSLLVAYGKVM